MEPINTGGTVWKEKQGLKKEIQKVEDYKPQFLLKNPVDFYRDVGEVWRETYEMSEDLSVLGQVQMKKYSFATSARVRENLHQQSMELSEKAQKVEEQGEKRSNREKAANKRLGANHRYFNRTQEDLQGALQRNKEMEASGEIRPTLANLTGDEFATNPETGEMLVSIDELLKRRSEMKRYIDNALATQQEALKTDTYKQDALAVNQEILHNLNEAIHLYYLSNGINPETGKTVGTIRRNKARNEFALAMETYRDSMKNAGDTFADKQFNRMYKDRKDVFDRTYKNYEEIRKTSGMRVADSKETSRIRNTLTKEQQEERLFTNKFPLSASFQEDVVAIRDMIREHEKGYHDNKKLIDRLYHDWLDSAMTVSQIGDSEKVVGAMVDNPTVSKKLSERMEKKKDMALLCMQAQINGITYLLKGMDDMELADAVFLKQKYGLVTVAYSNAADRIEGLKGKTPQQTADMRLYGEKLDQESEKERALAQETEAREREIIRAGNKPEEDRELVQKKRVLERLRAQNCNLENPSGLLWRQRLSNSPEELDIYETKQKMFRSIFMSSYEENPDVYYTVKDAEGKEIHKKKYNMNAGTRDIISNVSSLLHPGDCGMEKAIHFLDNILLLQGAGNSHIDKEHREGAEEEVHKLAYRKAFVEELEMQRAAREEIEAYITREDLDAKALAHLSMEELINATTKAQPVFKKTQGLYARIKSIWKKPDFQTMPKEEQAELLQIMAFMGSAMSFSKGFQDNFSDRAKGEETKTAVTRKQHRENYLDECREYLNWLQQDENT